ncbi:uncharacterized protein METZ01_LOCUS372931 [marine metagenome]|uniref:Uncharacterized protein n=1 Tax=marine metagenome TaxID=408172 RepID=A0A382TF21_9ZZZZ
MSDSTEIPASSLTTAGKTAIIVAAFLGWFFAGMHLGITSLAMGSAAKDLLKKTEQYEASVAGEMSVDENGTVKVDVVADKRLKSDSSK